MTSTPFTQYIEEKNNLDAMIKQKFAEYLSGRLHDPLEVFSWMKASQVHLAGGSVLKFINGEPLGDSDLDFFDFGTIKTKKSNLTEHMMNFLSGKSDFPNEVTYEKAKKIFTLDNFLHFDSSSNFRRFNDHIVPIETVKRHGTFACQLYFGAYGRYKGETDRTEESYEHDANIKTITDYAYVKKDCKEDHREYFTGKDYMGSCGINHIQIMHVVPKFSSMQDYMEKLFDFDFCKVSFDGDTFTILHPEAVKNKECQYKSTHHDDKLALARKSKYEKRGYKFL